MSGSSFGFFGTDPWWMVILKAVAIFGMLVVLTLFTIWWERRVVSRMQNRIGPNRVGPAGLLQSLMDGFKLAFKEEIIPKSAHVAVYWIAPVISATAAFLVEVTLSRAAETFFSSSLRRVASSVPLAAAASSCSARDM